MSLEKVTDLKLNVLERITSQFSEGLKIGSGGYGDVYRGQLNGCDVAVKKLYLDNKSIDDKSFTNEFRQLMKVQHENIIRLIGYCYEIKHKHTEHGGQLVFSQVIDRALCFEYMPEGSLANHISDDSCIHDWATTFKIIKGTCDGLHYLHKGRGEADYIYHLDLKPGNILLDKDLIPKIADFGLSRLFGDSKTHETSCRTGTLGFMAPEYIKKGTITPKNDVFSLGVIIFYLVAGRKRYDDYCVSSSSPREEFIERVQVYWKKRMRAATDYACDEIDLLGVKICIELAMRCVEDDRKVRPCTKEIIDELHKLDAQMEKMSKKDTQSLTGQVKRRKIVESTSGKGTLGSSEKAEASSIDINSSAQGQWTEQTKQCKFFPPQSFSRNYPTNSKFLDKENDRAVDLPTGAMGSLLDKLGKLLTDDYNLKDNIKADIMYFSLMLRKMHQTLRKLEKLAGVKIWLDQVRKLSYRIEDMVDGFLVLAESDPKSSAFRELTREGLKLWENEMMTHHQLDDVIREIKNQVQDVADMQETYNFDINDVVPNASAKDAIEDLRNFVIYEDETQLVGIKTPKDKLIKLFEEDGDVSNQNLKIVSIFGLGGLGKTTLANAVYDMLKEQYHTRAFVPVGQNPDVKKVLTNIISEFEEDFNAKSLNVGQLLKKLNELLKNKRYFIVIDDIWDSSAWKHINRAFPRNNCGSRVITTTRIYDVALATCNGESEYVYCIKALSAEDSRELFFGRTFGRNKDCLRTPRKEEISTAILKKCGGMPLAINSIGSLLAGKVDSTWEYVWKSLGAMVEANTELDDMKQILDLSYIHLPDHLKTCLLYVSMYPEDREIDKNDLVKKWVAEGFVHMSGNSGLNAEDVAEKYFKELISMCMIQPGKRDNYNNEVLSCRVHDIILDLMRSKSNEENFIHVIDGSKEESREICRVSIHHNDTEDTRILETINKGSLSHVRSVLTYRGSLQGHVDHILELKYVRVLHLELYELYNGQDPGPNLTGISKLLLLRYLKVACNRNVRLWLPDQIGELRQLETIDLTRCNPIFYPSDIVSLPWLSHLSLTGTEDLCAPLPDGIERLKSLHTLVGVDVLLIFVSVENIKGLAKLTNLRKLEIRLADKSLLSEEDITMHMNALHSSIYTLSASLRILKLDGKRFPKYVPAGWSSTLFRENSPIRELGLSGCIFERCPKWISQLRNLYKLTITVNVVADGVSIVAGLPSLAYFHLTTYGIFNEKEESVVIPGGGAFQALKELLFHCRNAALTFEAGAMPKLEKLEIMFRCHMTPTPQSPPGGIQHLPAGTLKQITLRVFFFVYESYTQNKVYLDHLLEEECKEAFKRHHPGADIIIQFPEGFFYVSSTSS